MSDIVKKYQHYFAESTRLQEMVNEQAAYIEELEAAILELSEGEIKIPFTGGKSLSWGHDADILKRADFELAVQAAKRAEERNKPNPKKKGSGSSRIEDLLKKAI